MSSIEVLLFSFFLAFLAGNMILLLEDNSCRDQRGKKCEFSMNFCKILVLANEKIFRTI